MNEYLKQLNLQQREAVLYCDGPQLVIAGAGSGKTRVLTYKIVHLLHEGYTPYRIMALTFTNKAAREMRDRITALVSPEVASQLWMGTFHSIFCRLLRYNSERIGFRHDFTIYDQSDSRSLIKLIIKDMELDDKLYRPASIQAHISNMKNAMFGPDEYQHDKDLRNADERSGRPEIYRIYRAYWNRCRIASAMDFDDLLFYTNLLFRDNPDVLEKYQQMFQYILVDEYQDTNFAQHLIVMQLSRLHNHLCVVGDDAQSIYSFRGANINNILGLQKFYPDLVTHKLEQNYRSTQSIIDAANTLIEKNESQIHKHIFSTNPVGDRIKVISCFNDYEEAYVVCNQIAAIKARQGDKYEDFAVLYRTNAQSRVLEEALSNGGRRDKHGNVRHAIPYRVYGGLSFYQRKEIKDAIAYFRLAINPDDDEAIRRVINYPQRGIGDTTVGKIQHCAITHGVSMWYALTHPNEVQLNVNRGTLKKLSDFAQLIQSFANMTQERSDAYNHAKFIIERTQLMAVLSNDKTPENISRLENLTELMSGIHIFVESKLEVGDDDTMLGNYLAEVSLMTDQDTDNNNNGDCVTLMTVHAAKGLEFKNVIIVGVEEDLFPSAMSKDSMSQIEEERRLLYVAITRAMHTCLMTYSKSRFVNGVNRDCQPSRFLHDIDPNYLFRSDATSSSGDMFKAARNQWGEATTWSDITTRSKPSSLPDGRPPKSTSQPKTIMRPQQRTRPNSNFTLHTVDELSEGLHIVHSTFGEGEIVCVDTSGDEPKIKVEFQEGLKTLLLKFAKFQIVD